MIVNQFPSHGYLALLIFNASAIIFPTVTANNKKTT
jgi:hypothetical protein